jgi:hypothetical protein
VSLLQQLLQLSALHVTLQQVMLWPAAAAAAAVVTQLLSIGFCAMLSWS